MFHILSLVICPNGVQSDLWGTFVHWLNIQTNSIMVIDWASVLAALLAGGGSAWLLSFFGMRYALRKQKSETEISEAEAEKARMSVEQEYRTGVEERVGILNRMLQESNDQLEESNKLLSENRKQLKESREEAERYKQCVKELREQIQKLTDELNICVGEKKYWKDLAEKKDETIHQLQEAIRLQEEKTQALKRRNSHRKGEITKELKEIAKENNEG